MSVSGSIDGVSLDGTTFNVAADADITQNQPSENERIPHSGGSMKKVTKKVATAEGVVLIVDGTEMELLNDLHNRTDDFPMSYTEASGDTYSTTGSINVSNKTTQENRAEITMQPAGKGRFEPVLAG